MQWAAQTESRWSAITQKLPVSQGLASFKSQAAFISNHGEDKILKKEKEAYQEIDGLNDVQEHLVLPVLDALRAPGHCVGDGGWGPWGPRFQLVAFLSYVPVGPGSQLSSSGTDILQNSPSL